MSQSILFTYKLTFHYDILILLAWNMNEYVQKGYSNETAKITSNQMAVHITATHTVQPKITIYKNKSNQMTGSYI